MSTEKVRQKEGEAYAAKGLIFRVKILSAIQLRSSFSMQLGDTNATKYESTRDPYVVLKCTGTSQVHNTSTVLHNSEAPQWHEEFFFDVDRHNPVLILEVKDKEAVKGDVTVGSAKVRLQGMISKDGEKEFWVPLVDVTKKAAIPDVVGELGFTITECYRMSVQPLWATRVAPLPSLIAKGLTMETKLGNQKPVSTSPVKQIDPKWSDKGGDFFVPYGEVSQVTFTLFSMRHVGPPLARGFYHLKLRGQPLPLERDGLKEHSFPLYHATPHDEPGAAGNQVKAKDASGKDTKEMVNLQTAFQFGVCLMDDCGLEGVKEAGDTNEEMTMWPPSKPATIMFDCHVKEVIGLPESDNPDSTPANTARHGRLELGRDKYETQKVAMTSDAVILHEKFHFVMQPPLLEEQKQKLRAAKLLPPSENEAFAQLRLSMWEKIQGTKKPAESLGIGAADLRSMRPGCVVPLSVPVGEATFKLQLQLYHQITVKINSVLVSSSKDYNGLCDPFVTMRMGGTSFTSRIVPEDREAMFNDTFRFHVPPCANKKELQLKIEVWDADFILLGKGIKKDVIGLVEVDLSKLRPREVEDMKLPILVNTEQDGTISLSVSNDLHKKDGTLAIHEARYGFRTQWRAKDDSFLHPTAPSELELEDLFSAPKWLGASSEYRNESDFSPTWIDATKKIRAMVEKNKLVLDPSSADAGSGGAPNKADYLKNLLWPDCPNPEDIGPPIAPHNDAGGAPTAGGGDSGNNMTPVGPTNGSTTPGGTAQLPPPGLPAIKVGPRMLMIRFSVGAGEVETEVMSETGARAFEPLIIDPPQTEGSDIFDERLHFAVESEEKNNEETKRLAAKVEEMEAEKKATEEAAAESSRKNKEQQAEIAAKREQSAKELAEIEERLKVLKSAQVGAEKDAAAIIEKENKARIRYETASASGGSDAPALKKELDQLEQERKDLEAEVKELSENRQAEEEKRDQVAAATLSEEELLQARISKLKSEEEESARKVAEARSRAERAKAESASLSAEAAKDAGRAAAQAREKANAEADEADRLRKLVEAYEAEKVKAEKDAATAKKQKEEEDRQMDELRRAQEKEAAALEAKIQALAETEEKKKLELERSKLEREQRDREEKEARQKFQREETARQEKLLEARINRLKTQEAESAEKLRKAEEEVKRRQAEAEAKAKQSQSSSGSGSVVPSYWTPGLPTDGTVNKVELSNDPLWKDRFQTLLDDTCRRNTLGAGRDQIIKSGKYNRLVFHRAWRLENAKLYSLYAAHRDLQLTTPKQSLSAKTHDLPSSKWITEECGLRTAERNELLLWHGTKPDCVDLIATDGFDERFSKLSGLFGAGVYLADEVSKSDQYTTPTPIDKPKTGIYHIFLVRATMGDYKSITDGTKDARRAPAGCQSIMGQIDRNKYKEYVLYDGWLAYPEYIIEYKRNYI